MRAPLGSGLGLASVGRGLIVRRRWAAAVRSWLGIGHRPAQEYRHGDHACQRSTGVTKYLTHAGPFIESVSPDRYIDGQSQMTHSRDLLCFYCGAYSSHIGDLPVLIAVDGDSVGRGGLKRIGPLDGLRFNTDE